MINFRTFLAFLAIALFAVSCERDTYVAEAVTADENADLISAAEIAESEDMLVLDPSIRVDAEDIVAHLGLDKKDQEKTSRPSSVYTISNEVDGNEVIQFNAAEDGTLTEVARFPTGGTGTGGGLGNQGAVIVNNRTRTLYAVDPGSNHVNRFFIFRDGSLELLSRRQTDGIRPVSVTEYEGNIYVVHAGSDNVQGFFTSDFTGAIRPIANSLQPLSAAGSAPAQVTISRNGRVLVVTEKATNAITTFNVDGLGRLSNRRVFTDAGETPFGFQQARGNRYIVSEANSGQEGQGTISTYRINNRGVVRRLNGPLALNETASCWIALNRSNGDVFATNTGSASITSLFFDRETSDLTIANNGAVTAAVARPLDAGLTRDGAYLYVLATGTDAILSYRVGENGNLVQIDTDGGLPDAASGIAVRR